MSLIGLVRHLTEMERAYAQRVAEPGLPPRYVTDADPDADSDAVARQDVQAGLVACTEHWEGLR